MIRARTPFEPRRARAMRWAVAGVFVVVAHVGCTALALMQWPEVAEDGVAGPVIVEMVAVPPPPVDSPDVAHGPRAEEAKLTPQATEKVEQEVEKETPPVAPSPAPEPEVVLPKPVEAKEEPEEERPKEEQPQQSSPEQALAAPLTTAPPRVEAPERAVPAAPAPGASAQAARLMATWEKALVSHLNRFKRYPDAARSRRSQGSVHVQFTIDRTGRVLATRVVRSSGSEALDHEATAVLQRASPMPAPPTQFAGATFDLTLPVQFQIR